MDMMSQRSNKDALRARLGTLPSQGSQGRLAGECGATPSGVSNFMAEWCSEKAILPAAALGQRMSKRSFSENKNARVRLRCV